MNDNFQRSYMKEYTVKKTYLASKELSFNFEVHDHNVVGDLEKFTDLYRKRRQQLWLDNGWNDGVWSEEDDLGYRNFLNVVESGKYEMSYYENTFFDRVPAKIKCCDEWITLGKFTNTCSQCNSDYNSGGQLLAPRHQWGEETGEHWTDCY